MVLPARQRARMVTHSGAVFALRAALAAFVALLAAMLAPDVLPVRARLLRSDGLGHPLTRFLADLRRLQLRPRLAQHLVALLRTAQLFAPALLDSARPRFG